jgi:hypothetical protein
MFIVGTISANDDWKPTSSFFLMCDREYCESCEPELGVYNIEEDTFLMVETGSYRDGDRYLKQKFFTRTLSDSSRHKFYSKEGYLDDKDNTEKKVKPSVYMQGIRFDSELSLMRETLTILYDPNTRSDKNYQCEIISGDEASSDYDKRVNEFNEWKQSAAEKTKSKLKL